MSLSHAEALEASPNSALAKLQSFIAARRQDSKPVERFEALEGDLHALFRAAECEVLGDELAKFDIDVPVVEVDGVAYRQVLRCEDTYFSSSGHVRVERSLYSSGAADERAICPMELRAGIIEGRWTPQAAKQASWAVAHLTPKECEDLFRTMGGLSASKSSFDRLPKELGAQLEVHRESFEAQLRVQEATPDGAVTVAVSLDGVMVPMKKPVVADEASPGETGEGGNGAPSSDGAEAGQKQADNDADENSSRYKEASCATLSYYDAEGELLSNVRMGRMPESKKATLKAMLEAELKACLSRSPTVAIVKVADGAKDNWTYLESLDCEGDSVVDFYHAAEHLKVALDAAYGTNSPKGDAQFKKLRHVLRHEDNGVETVIRALLYLHKKHPRSKKIKRELTYFRRNRRRMQYAAVKASKRPIGSGIVEAACKTLVTERMKRSGMRWRIAGGQAVLSFRALVQSNRFDRAWKMLAAVYIRDVTVPENVIALNARRSH
jgi:hypothetical protein